MTRALGIPNPGGGPLAELWMGAHPKAPSLAECPSGPRPLNLLLEDEPDGTLGPDAVARFGPSLPFLFKVLSAATPLSIQAHPGKRKAERGYERENLGGVPIDAPERNYKDPNHKPEMAVALTSFELLCGFRPIPEMGRAMRLISPDLHHRQLSRLEANPGKVELSVFFYALVSMQERDRLFMLESARARVEELLARGRVPDTEIEAFRWVLRIMDSFPGDIGAFGPLLLNHVTLRPGEAVFIAPGELHAHLGGTCLEIMANSDNVIRGALTPKYVDLPELISVLGFSPARTPVLLADRLSESEERYPISVPDFALSRILVSSSSSHTRRGSSPEILLCTEGQARLSCEGEQTRTLERGQSVFVEASAGAYRLEAGTDPSSHAILYKAYVPEAS